MLNNFFKSKAVLLIVSVVLIGLKIDAKQYPYAPAIAIDSPGVDLIFPINDPLDPTNFSLGLIDFQFPLNIQNNVQYNPLTGQYIFNSLLGDSLNFRPSSEVSLNDYLMMQHEKSMTDFWKKNLDDMSDYKYKTIEDEIKINEPAAKKIFGSDFVEIRPQGSAELSFGLNSSRTDNPVLPERNRKMTTFDFDQKIQMNLTGKIGDLMDLGFNYNTEATFDFDNQLNLDYSGKEDDILQKLEAGNVTLPLNSTLISGSQSLFGIKSELKFGKLTATTVLSQQKGQKKEIEVSGGAQLNEFEINADNYEENRHFFLSFYYRDAYDQSMRTLPLITSGVQIQRIEVWVTNRNNSVQNTRNILCFTDLGEPIVNNLENQLWNSGPFIIPDNNHNGLYNNITSNSNVRNYVNASNELSGPNYNMEQGIEFEKVENARMLSPNEFTYNSVLGFISLNQSLNNDQVLGVSYQYTYAGKTYQVGELSTDGVAGQNALFLKLLKSTVRNPKKKLWDLMMKNVYSLGAYQVDPNNFRLDIWYNNPLTSIDINYIPKTGVDDKLLIQLLDLDRLNQQQQMYQDGLFDFVPIVANQGKIPNGGTINPRNGRLYFTTVEPFGKTLKQKMLKEGISSTIIDKVAFTQLYDSTKTAAQQLPEINRFKIKGRYQSSVSSEISLNTMNIPQGSVVVTAGGQILIEGSQYMVDYNLGRVKILDDGILSSGTPIKISLESNSLFSVQMKTLFGTHLDYKINKNANIGATILKLKERPLTPKVNAGDEPISNTMLGLDGGFRKEVPTLTKLVDMLPFIETKKKSMVNFSGEIAALIPGHNKAIDITQENGSSYIDDFEGSQSAIDIRTINNWVLASVPQGQPDLFPEASLYNDINYGKNRAKFSWYVIDPLFHSRTSSLTPRHIKGSAFQDNHLMRQVLVDEVFPNKQLGTGQLTNIPVFDISYYPKERGPYNFDVESSNYSSGINPSNGELNDPETRWGGIMRTLTTNDFEAANIEFIQFWVMDPYTNYSITNEEGLPSGMNPQDLQNQVGDLYINLGNISEDILKDNRKMYENGLPLDDLSSNTTSTIWGKVPTNPSIIYAFDQEDASRTKQDIGLDGLTDEEERIKFPSLAALEDPASDNYRYYRGGDFDATDASIISRYKLFNNTQGNSPTLNQSSESFPTSSTTYPDVEDINKDQTMNTVESFFEYKVSLNSSDLVVGQNYIVDQKETQVTLKNGEAQTAKWYQFRIPIRSGIPINNISDFNSIRFIRMFMTNFKMPVILRFGELDLVRGDWRRYTRTLDPEITPDLPLEQQDLNDFEVGVVNIEQNEGRYVLPPGIERERLQGSTTVQQQNEQSVTLKVTNLPQDKVRAIYKNISVDLRRYKELKMFLHAEPVIVNGVDDDELTAIIRLGTDLNDNFYQIEIPLKISTYGSLAPLDVWPEANNLDATLEKLGKIKLARDVANAPINELFTASTSDSGELVLRVKGNPTLSQIRTIMLGVRNNSPLEKSAEIWFNELRSAGFDNDGGWAAVISADANFADVATLSMTGRMQTVGFGNVEDRVSQRSLDETKEYDISTSINLGKMMPKKWGIELPMNYSVGEQFIDPKFDPQYQDVELAAVEAANLPSNLPRGTDVSRNYTKRSSISFMNVRKNRNPESSKKPKFYDVENLSVSYSFNEESHRDYNIEGALNQKVMAAASYNFTFKPKFLEPFKKKELFKSKYLQLIRDINFNPVPTSLAINSRINRSFNEQRSRNLVEGLSPQPTLKQRRFLFDWDYALAFNFTKSLAINFNASNSYIYDAFGNGDDLEIFNNFFNVGRPTQYSQKLNSTYKIPLNKIPYLSFIGVDYAYTADFDWKATSQDATIVERVGNLIQNANTHNVTGSLNFAKLYKDTKFESLFLKKKNRKKSGPVSLQTPKSPSQVSERKRKNEPIGRKVVKGFYDLITSLKTGKISYTENNGQLLPGYEPEVGFLGRNNFGGGLAPSLGFVFGSQVDIRNTALENGWLVTPRADGEDYYDKTYTRTHFNKLDYNFSLKPVKDLTIEVTGNKIKTRSLAQQLDIRVDTNDPGGNGYIDETIPAFITGNYSTSYSMFSTAFKDGDQLFNQLRTNRIAVSRRLGEQAGINVNDPTNIDPVDGTVIGYGASSQDVLLPSFLAAYSGKDANNVNLGIFREIPIPAWNLRYTGLMKYKWFKSNFSSFSISHGYKSSYTVSSFTNNLQFDSNDPTITNAAGDFESSTLVSSATLVDEFSPLIRVDMKMKNSFSMRGELKRDRTLTMNFNNSTLTDIKGTEYIFGFGYVFKDVKMKTSFTGKKQTLKGDINVRADVSLRDNLTLVRSVNSDNDQISGGQKLFSIKFTADYRLNSNLTASFYYNHQTSRYAISTTFPRQSINAGFNFIYNLGGN